MQAQRTEIRIAVGNSRVASWRWQPPGDGPFPAVVMAHGIGAVRHVRLDEIGQHFADSGYVVYAFDYRHFGDSEGEPRQLWDPERQRADIGAVLDHAAADAAVDSRRLVLWGTSFGGGLVLQVAASRRDLAAVIAQCPLVDGRAELFRMHPVTAAKVVAAAIADSVRNAVGAGPAYVKIAGRPGQAALLTQPHAERAYLDIVPPGAPWHNRITARAALRMPFHRPIEAAERIECPVLFCICDADVDVSVERGYEAARRAPAGTAIGYPIGHFDIYDGEARRIALRDQLEFLAGAAPPAAAGGDSREAVRRSA